MDETTSLWNKPVNDLTVGDNVKISLIATGGVVALTAAITGLCVGVDKFKSWKANRQNKTTDPE